MKIISHTDIVKLDISPAQCVNWVCEAFKLKYESYLPAKYSLHLPNEVFINTMPCYIPCFKRFGVKIVTRYPCNTPSLESLIYLYDTINGSPILMIDGNWITTMRTGGVAALTIKTLEKSNSEVYSFIGLGNTARATLLCLIAANPDKHLTIKILKYKDQAKSFIDRFSNIHNITFIVVETYKDAIQKSDVIISCVTYADLIFGEDEWFKEGVLVVPVHTRGFQNCDLFFDKVFADDTEHVRSFSHFGKFKQFNEFSNILLGKCDGRINDSEKIIAYNIGIALHDVYFANCISKLVKNTEIRIDNYKKLDKFWI